MEKKKKTTEISAARWQSDHGNAWKHVVYWLNIKELANCRSVSQTIFAVVAGEDRGRVPWEIFSSIISNDVSGDVWSTESKLDFAREIYRWMILHCAPFDPQSGFVKDILRQAMVIGGRWTEGCELLARLKDKTFFLFNFLRTWTVDVSFHTADRDAWISCSGCRCCVKTQKCPDYHRVSLAGGLRQARAGCNWECADWGHRVLGPGMTQIMNAISSTSCEYDPVSGLPCYRDSETKQLVFPQCNLLEKLPLEGQGLVTVNGYTKVALQGILKGLKPFNFSRVTISDFKAAVPKKV